MKIVSSSPGTARRRETPGLRRDGPGRPGAGDRQDLEQLDEHAARRASLRHPLTLSAPMKWLLAHSGAYQLRCTGFGINMLSGNCEFACLATIDDPAWWWLRT